ncbi:protein-disulfide reductase DsbD family protein [Cellvibrio mixtus]|uniref:protein-disulfide reductase DsbD family protein n=1 Tax=Cellvibrio mixtus TaxID=39650 RepID=UPI000694DF67|nr:protein-disulfide reductase DsbD [Cellvibrio mixtus]
MFSRLISFALQSVLLMACFSAVAANDPFAPKNQSLNQSPVSLENKIAAQDEFLPVAQAFIPEYTIAQGKLVLHWKIADSYYLYEERFKFKADEGITLIPSYTPGKMKYDELFERETMVHYHEVTASFDLSTINKPFILKLEFQGCADAGLCYPPQKKTLSIDPANALVVEQSAAAIPVASTPPTTEAPAPAPAESGWLLQAILLAILGGTILNLMPCVFPVLSIKVMSLAAADRARLAIHGWVYTLGIVACFVGFAVALLIARKGGEAIGWGFQLQSPGLIAALAYLFFVMGLSMSGLVNVGTSLMGAGQGLTQKSGLSGSFFTGVLAAVVASPCTAPFMGTALGFALTQPAYVCIAVFAALGFGMALPLLLLCYLPALAQRLPKPGVWMDNLKQFLAFPLYLSAIWLLWVYGRQTSVNGMATLAAGAVLIAFGLWLSGRDAKGFWQWIRRLLIALSWIAAISLPFQTQHQKTETSSRWQPYNAELVAELRAQGRPVFINLTADWCLTCLANERIALHTEAVEKTFDELDVATFKGDWTNTDPKITELLQEYGRSGVPLYLWFPANSVGKAQILPQLLTKDLLVTTLTGKNN